MSASKHMATSLRADAWRRLKKDRCAVICFWIVIGFTLLALFGEEGINITLEDITAPYQQTALEKAYQPPLWSIGWARMD